jgi:O-antigen ligase
VASVLVIHAPDNADVASSGNGISLFWEEMSTISEGTSAGTGNDREILWRVAWEEFKDNPIFGVGPFNFGVAAPKYISHVSDRGERYADPNSIWGRALHNGYFQILSEGGALGVIGFCVLLVDFLMGNSRARRAFRMSASLSNEPDKFRLEGYYHLATGIRLAMVAFLLNLFFYDITYHSWAWDLFIVNKVLVMQSSHESSLQTA